MIVSTAFNSHGDEFAGTGSRWPVAQIKAIASDGTDYIYVGDGDTLSIYRKSDLERLSVLRLNGTTEGVRGLAYYSTPTAKAVYVASGYSGLQVVNVANPENPTQDETTSYLTSEFGTGTETTHLVHAYDVSIHGSYAYIADNNYGLRAVNLNAPLAPSEVGHLNLVAQKGAYYALGVDMYGTDADKNVYAVMILNSTSGPVIGRINVSGFGANTLSMVNDTATGIPTIYGSMAIYIRKMADNQTDRYAFCIDSYGNDLLIYDILHTEDPETIPKLMFSQRTNENYTNNALALFQPRALDVRSIDGVGNYAFVTTHYPYRNEKAGINLLPGLRIIDVTDVTTPKAKSQIEIFGANSVKVLDNEVFVTSQMSGVHKLTVNISDDGTIDDNYSEITAPSPVNAADICVVHNEVIYLPDNIDSENSGITILRVAPMEKTSEEKSAKAVETTDSETASREYASPAFPVHETFLKTPGQAKAFCIKENLFFGYIADGKKGIQFVNLHGTGLTSPYIVDDSNIPIQTPYEVIDVAIFKNTLVVLTTDPDHELWAVDVTDGTSEASPTDYSGLVSTADIEGTSTAKKVITYKGQSGMYALVANGANGVSIVNVIPDDDENMIVLPPSAENVIKVETQDARNVFADPERSGIFAFVADGAGGVKILQLYKEENLADMAPEIIATIDTSEYGNAIDVNYYDGHLYVLTDKPEKALLLYSLSDVKNPQFKGLSSSFGKAAALWATEITLPCKDCTVKFSFIKGAFIADGPAGLSFRQVTDESSSVNDRQWSSDKMCFISSAGTDDGKTGLFPVFVFLGLCLGLVLVFAAAIRLNDHASAKNKKI
jgi:hypothetical protein